LLTVTEAAELTGTPRSTMALWVRSGRFPRATTLQLGKVRAAWYVPITDLIAAGLVNRQRAKDAPLTRAGRVVVDELEKKNRELTAEVRQLAAEVKRLELLNEEQQAIITNLRRRLGAAGRSDKAASRRRS
jgi:excisionase family DNA binding protein